MIVPIAALLPVLDMGGKLRLQWGWKYLTYSVKIDSGLFPAPGIQNIPMNFTAREDYGLRAILDLAAHAQQQPIQAREVAARQAVPEQFLEQLLGTLRRAGLVKSVRGASGGFLLAREPSAITAGDVLRALTGPLVSIDCLGKGHTEACSHGNAFGVHIFWERLASAIEDVADGLTLQNLLDLQMEANADASFMMNI